MNKPLIDQRHFETEPWKQELIWIQRNKLGVIVGMSEKPPQSGEMVPTVPHFKRNEPVTGVGAD